MVAKHSVHTLMSVTRLRRGRFEWQHEPSVSSCHVSGKSSQISIYSIRIFLVSFGGTEPKPGRVDRSLAGITAVSPDVVGDASRAAGSPDWRTPESQRGACPDSGPRAASAALARLMLSLLFVSSVQAQSPHCHCSRWPPTAWEL